MEAQLVSISRTSRRKGVAAALAASTVVLVAVPSAFADNAQVASGSTVLTLNKATAKTLTTSGVRLAPIRPAAAGKGGTVSFPITGGTVDSTTAAGNVTHSGGLAFRANGVTVRLTNFTIKVGAKSKLFASVGTARVAILDLNVKKAKIARGGADGTSILVGNVKGTLTGAAAKALNKAFDTKLFKKGIPLGTAAVDAVPFQTQLALDSVLSAALTGLGVTPAPIGPAVAAKNGRLSFPVSEGVLVPKTFAGLVTHSGGISLTKGTTKVELTEFLIDTTKPQAELTAVIGGNRVAILTLDLTGSKPVIKGKSAIVDNVVTKLTPGAASALNVAFGTTALKGGTTFGTAFVVAPTAAQYK
jgi:hypothetical protein